MNNEQLPVTDLLANRRIDEASPDFWTQLDEQLANEPAPNSNEHRRAWWGVVALAAAALIFAAVFGVRALTDNDDPPAVTQITTPTTNPTPVDEEPETETIDISASLEWDYQTADTLNFDSAAADENMTVFDDVFYAVTTNGLSRSDDGINWQALDESNTTYEGDIAPSWTNETSRWEPLTLISQGESLLVLDAPRSGKALRPLPLHLWRSEDAETWSLTTIEPTNTQAVAGSKWSKPTVAIAASPDTVLVASETVAEIDWWSFDPGTLDPEGIRSDPDSSQVGTYPEFLWSVFRSGGFDVTGALPGRDGITVTTYRSDGRDRGTPTSTNLVRWEDLDPEARATYDLWLRHQHRVALYSIDSAGEVSTFEWPLRHRSPGGLDWNGNEFVAWNKPGDNSQHTALSPDGSAWSKSNFRHGIEVTGTIGDVIVTRNQDGIETSTDLGATFEPIDIDVTNFAISVDGKPTWRNPAWDLPADQHEFTDSELRNAVKSPANLEPHGIIWAGTRVRHNVAINLLLTAGTPDILILSSTDGKKWKKAIVPRSLAANETSDPIPSSVFVGPDGTIYVYDDRGDHIGKLID